MGSLLKRLRGCSVPVFREQMIAIGGLPASPLPQPQVDSACRGHPHTAGVIASHHCYGDKRLGTVSTVVVSCLDPTEIPAGGHGTSVPSIATRCPSPGWPEAPRVGSPGGSGGQKLEAVGSCLPPPMLLCPTDRHLWGGRCWWVLIGTRQLASPSDKVFTGTKLTVKHQFPAARFSPR